MSGRKTHKKRARKDERPLEEDDIGDEGMHLLFSLSFARRLLSPVSLTATRHLLGDVLLSKRRERANLPLASCLRSYRLTSITASTGSKDKASSTGLCRRLS